jgi:hypothetical protein
MIRNALALAAALLCVGALASPASAQFHSMDRMRNASLGGVRADVSVYESDTKPDGTTKGDSSLYLRSEVYAQHVGELLGMYGHVHLANWFPDEGDSSTVLGNVELGGFITRRNVGNNMILRVGIVLPTAQEGDEYGKFNLRRNGWGRLTDMPTSVPAMTALRVSASPYVRGGAVFFRADFGIDMVLPSGSDLTVVPRGNLGVGYDMGLLIFTGEFVNTKNITQFLGGGFLHAFTFSVGHGILRAGVTVPLREDYELTVFSINLETGLNFGRR